MRCNPVQCCDRESFPAGPPIQAFDKFKGDDEKLNISELKLAFNSLIGQHQLPEDTVGDMRRILESYDVHDAYGTPPKKKWHQKNKNNELSPPPHTHTHTRASHVKCVH